jgi:Mn-containing catalase
MTGDPGVRKMLAFMLARDTMHQNQWLAPIEAGRWAWGNAGSLELPAVARG